MIMHASLRQNDGERAHLSAIYLAVVMALIPLFNLNVAGRGLFLYLGAGVIFTFFTLRRYTVLFETRLFYVLFALYTLISSVWAQNFTGAELFQCVKTIFFVISISFVVFNYRELRWVYALQIVMGLTIAIILCTTSSTMAIQGEWLDDTQRSILVIGGVQIDPNYASILLVPVSVFLFRNVLSRRGSALYTGLSIVGLIVVLFALFRSGSRGGLLAIAASMTFYYIRCRENMGRKLFLLIVGIFSVILFLPNLLSLLPSSVANRFTLSTILSTGGAGRTDLWLSLIENLFSSPFAFIFGHGYGAALDYLGIASHNYFLDILYNGGVIQLVVLVLLYWKLFKVADRNRNVFVQAILFGYITISLTVSVGNNMFFWTGIVFVMLLGERGEIELGGEIR